MADVRAARRYAGALFNVAVREKALEAVEGDMKDVLELWRSQPRLAEAMSRPQIPLAAKARVWEQLLAGSASPLILKFVTLLVDKRRIDLLPDIVREFQQMADRFRNVTRAQVTTAVPLTPDLASALAKQLSATTGSTVELVQVVDPSVIGGVIVRVADRVMDGSLRGQLQNLHHKLVGFHS